MSIPQSKSGFINIDNAKLYYEIAGTGTPFVMIHAGVADSRQWNNEFTYFSQSNQVIRYDMRGYGSLRWNSGLPPANPVQLYYPPECSSPKTAAKPGKAPTAKARSAGGPRIA